MLIKPDEQRRIGWRARYVDPDSGRTVKVSLDPSLSTVELREDWAARKSKALGKRRLELELEGGAPRATGTALSDAIETYFKAHPQLAPRTLKIYRTAAEKLLGWAERARVTSADDLNRARLMAFRAELVNAPKRAALKGGKRGTRVNADATRAPVSINQDLRAARTVLGYLCDADLLPRTTHDDLRRALKRMPAIVERPDFLSAKECGQLIEAALRHDSEKFEATREEHAGKAPKGSTPRYDAIAPFVAVMLLTGMRVGHCLALDWADVNEHEVAPRGGTQTKRPGGVDLEVSPALAKLLAALRPKNARAGRVFPRLTQNGADTAAVRMVARFGAPEFSWQKLRRTCGCFLTCAPGIFGAASAYRSAKQLGHSVTVAERHYLGVVRGIPPEARTLEAAMQIEAPLEEIIAHVWQSRCGNL